MTAAAEGFGCSLHPISVMPIHPQTVAHSSGLGQVLLQASGVQARVLDEHATVKVASVCPSDNPFVFPERAMKHKLTHGLVCVLHFQV